MKLKFERVAHCPVCRSRQRRRWDFRPQEIPIFECEKCGLIYLGKRLTSESIPQYYEGYGERRDRMDPKLRRLRMQMYEPDRQFVARWLTRGTVLDFGCGYGEFLAGFGPRIKKLGYDPDVDAVEQARKTFPRIRFLPDVTEVPKLDACIFRGTIQYQRDLIYTVKWLNSSIKRGGWLFLLATPNATSPAAVVQRENWSLHRPLEHLFHLSPQILPRLFKKFELVGIDYPYLGTPYENWPEDLAAFRRACRRPTLKERFPFWGSMMNVALRRRF